MCSCTFCWKKVLLLKVIKMRSSTKRRWAAHLNFWSHTLRKCLAVTDFVVKVTKTFFSANIPLHKLNNKHIKNLFVIGHSSPYETICKKIMLQFNGDELQRIGNAVYDKQIFLVVDARNRSSRLNIKVTKKIWSWKSRSDHDLDLGDQGRAHLCLYYCQPLPEPNSNSTAHAANNAVRSLGINRNCCSEEQL